MRERLVVSKTQLEEEYGCKLPISTGNHKVATLTRTLIPELKRKAVLRYDKYKEVLLKEIKAKGEIATRELYNRTFANELSYRRFSEIIKRMVAEGLVDRKVISKGRQGRESIVRART
ncbi:hypothetical protein DRN97_00195 [Methanosarcinales archaeon]|nr:MAG: hypothetical protein DRN97_00195 [Methanosarcinales archaeon]